MPLFGHHHEQFHEVRDVAQEDIDSLGSDMRDAEPDVLGGPPEAGARFAEAEKAHNRAEHQLGRANHPEQLAAISELLEVGRYQLAAATALAHGERLPERRPPCFFDPRHGPAVTAVKWAPEGGQERLIPVCAADAKLIKEQQQPQPRRYQRSDDDWWLWWNSPAYYGPWATGYYQGFGGGNFVGGLLTGSVLGAAIGVGGDVASAVGDVAGSAFGAIGDVVDGGLDAIGDVASDAVDAVDDVIGDLFGDGGDSGDGGGGDGSGGDGGGGDGGDGGGDM